MEQDTANLLGGCLGCAAMFVPFVVVLLGTYFIGSTIERRHFADILAREATYRAFPVVTFETVPADWNVTSSDLAQGSVVISVDYFKRFLASLRNLVGGRVKSYEPLLDRARREAVLRMIEDARARGYDAILNARIETSRIATGQQNKGVAGVEMLAFGTAVKLA